MVHAKKLIIFACHNNNSVYLLITLIYIAIFNNLKKCVNDERVNKKGPFELLRQLKWFGVYSAAYS